MIYNTIEMLFIVYSNTFLQKNVFFSPNEIFLYIDLWSFLFVYLLSFLA